MLLGRLRAAAAGMPFLATRAGMGSDLVAARGLREVADPYSEERLLAIPALHPDVAIVHAWRSDPHGNIQMPWPPDHLADVDLLMARAARRVIVTVEQLVERRRGVSRAPATPCSTHSRSTPSWSPSAAPLRPRCRRSTSSTTGSSLQRSNVSPAERRQGRRVDPSQPAKRRDGAGLKKRQREIIDAAAEIFHRKGYSETSVQDVADAVGILKGSLYYYIDSKEDLLFQMLLEVHEDAKSVVTETAALEVPPLDRLRVYVQRHVEYNAQQPGQDRRLLPRLRACSRRSARRRSSVSATIYEDFVKGLIEEAQAERRRSTARSTPSLISNAIFGIANWLYTWYKPAGSASPEYLGKLYAEVIVEGVTRRQHAQAPR